LKQYLTKSSGYIEKLKERYYNVDDFVKNQIYHRGHGAHRDIKLIKQDVCCVFCELSGEKRLFTKPSINARLHHTKKLTQTEAF